MKDNIVEAISPFSRKLQSNSPKVIRHYKKQLQKQIERGNVEQRAQNIHTIATKRKLTPLEEKELNNIDEEITAILLKAEKSIKGEQHNLPWSPRLHDAIKNINNVENNTNTTQDKDIT